MLGARSGRKCKDGIRVQKWILGPELDALREEGLRNLPKGEGYQGTD